SPQNVFLINNSPLPINLRAIYLGGGFSRDFVLNRGDCGVQLLTNSQCSLIVTFRPTGVDGRDAALYVLDNTGGSPHSLQLHGSGTVACPTVSQCAFSLLNERAS